MEKQTGEDRKIPDVPTGSPDGESPDESADAPSLPRREAGEPAKGHSAADAPDPEPRNR